MPFAVLEYICSNHGGRSEDRGRATIDALPEMLEAAGGRIPVFVDSGFRPGTDIVKALAMVGAPTIKDLVPSMVRRA
jgi:4-hydroxymandelate oxidase